jgi:hypothetical protein
MKDAGSDLDIDKSLTATGYHGALDMREIYSKRARESAGYGIHMHTENWNTGSAVIHLTFNFRSGHVSYQYYTKDDKTVIHAQHLSPTPKYITNKLDLLEEYIEKRELLNAIGAPKSWHMNIEFPDYGCDMIINKHSISIRSEETVPGLDFRQPYKGLALIQGYNEILKKTKKIIKESSLIDLFSYVKDYSDTEPFSFLTVNFKQFKI